MRALVTGSFRGAMMGGAAFFWLKGEGAAPKSAKQAENRLATLLKILPIAGSQRQPPRVKDERGRAVVVFHCICSDFVKIWLICPAIACFVI